VKRSLLERVAGFADGHPKTEFSHAPLSADRIAQECYSA